MKKILFAGALIAGILVSGAAQACDMDHKASMDKDKKTKVSEKSHKSGAKLAQKKAPVEKSDKATSKI